MRKAENDVRMDSRGLAAFLDKNEIEAEIVRLATETLTVAAAAKAVGVKPNQYWGKNEILSIS